MNTEDKERQKTKEEFKMKKEQLKEMLDNSYQAENMVEGNLESITVSINGSDIDIAKTDKGYCLPKMYEGDKEYHYEDFDELYNDLLKNEDWEIN